MLDAGARYPGAGDQPAPRDQPPGTSERSPAGGTRSGALAVLAAGALVAAGVLAVLALFPRYYQFGASSTSLTDTADQIVPTCVVAAGWLVAAALVGSRRLPLMLAGAFGAAGLALADLGLRAADVARLSAGGTGAGAGLWLLTAAWGAGLLGAGLALLGAQRAGGLRDLLTLRRDSQAADRSVMAAMAVAAVVLAVAFFPSWDRYVVTSPLNPAFSASFTAGDAFKNPGLVIAGNVWAGAAFGLLPIAALFVRQRRLGAALAAGVLVSALSQVLSAAVQTMETPDPQQLLPANILQTNPSVSLHLTGWFDAEFAALLVLAVLAALWASRHGAPSAGAGSGPATMAPPVPGGGWGGGWGTAGPGQWDAPAVGAWGGPSLPVPGPVPNPYEHAGPAAAGGWGQQPGAGPDPQPGGGVGPPPGGHAPQAGGGYGPPASYGPPAGGGYRAPAEPPHAAGSRWYGPEGPVPAAWPPAVTPWAPPTPGSPSPPPSRGPAPGAPSPWAPPPAPQENRPQAHDAGSAPAEDRQPGEDEGR